MNTLLRNTIVFWGLFLRCISEAQGQTQVIHDSHGAVAGRDIIYIIGDTSRRAHVNSRIEFCNVIQDVIRLAETNFAAIKSRLATNDIEFNERVFYSELQFDDATCRIVYDNELKEWSYEMELGDGGTDETWDIFERYDKYIQNCTHMTYREVENETSDWIISTTLYGDEYVSLQLTRYHNKLTHRGYVDLYVNYDPE